MRGDTSVRPPPQRDDPVCLPRRISAPASKMMAGYKAVTSTGMTGRKRPLRHPPDRRQCGLMRAADASAAQNGLSGCPPTASACRQKGTSATSRWGGSKVRVPSTAPPGGRGHDRCWLEAPDDVHSNVGSWGVKTCWVKGTNPTLVTLSATLTGSKSRSAAICRQTGDAILSVASIENRQVLTSIQNDPGLPQGPAGASAAA